MIYAFLVGDGALMVEADDEELAIAVLIDSKLIKSAADVGAGLVAMGNVIQVLGRGPLEVTGEEELLK